MPEEKEEKINTFRLGVHTSIAGAISKSVERAAELGCSTMQIFSHNPRQWKQSGISGEEAIRFHELRKRYDIRPVFVHASYLINLASLSREVLNKSINLLSYEMELADHIGAEYVVLHTGSASADDQVRARKRAIKSITAALGNRGFDASVLLENTAGERGDLTSSVRNMAEIMDNCNADNIAGICIDTCHAYCSGYDLASQKGIDLLIREIKKYIGLDKLRLIHLNDSKRPLGAGVDRHEHIGKGFIGHKGFKMFLTDSRIAGIPMILETPKSSEKDDMINLRKIRSILRNLDIER